MMKKIHLSKRCMCRRRRHNLRNCTVPKRPGSRGHKQAKSFAKTSISYWGQGRARLPSNNKMQSQQEIRTGVVSSTFQLSTQE